MRLSSRYLDLVLVISVSSACAARPTVGSRQDRDIDLAELPVPEQGARQAAEPTHPKSSNVKVSDDALIEGELEADIDSAERVAAESGSGVNNGAGPTGTYLSCSSNEVKNKQSFVIRGTALVTYIQGVFMDNDNSHSFACQTAEKSEEFLWKCRDFENQWLVEVERESLKASVLRPSANKVMEVIAELSCSVPKK